MLDPTHQDLFFTSGDDRLVGVLYLPSSAPWRRS